MVNWCKEVSLSRCGFCKERFETPNLDKLEGWFYCPHCGNEFAYGGEDDKQMQ